MPAAKKEKKNYTIPLTTLGIFSLLVAVSLFKTRSSSNPSLTEQISVEQESDSSLVDLPHPNQSSRISVEQALNSRRSYRSFQDKPLSISNLSQLLWSAQGVTANWGGRTVPSSKSEYPLSLYVISIQITDLDKGVYLYIPGDIKPAHQLTTVFKANLTNTLEEATDQYSLQHAPLIIAITSSSNKIESYLEAGHAAQNLFLQSESLGLGLATIRTFDEDILKETLKIPEDETIIYLVPVGYPKK